MEPEGQDNTGQETQGQEEVIDETPVESESSEGTGINPAWNELLEVMPASLHSQITPHLTKWDQNFQSKIGEVHSKYEPYKPFLENEINPEQLNYGLSLLQAIEERPEEVLKALQAYMGMEEEQAQTVEQGLPNEDIGPETPEVFNHPEYQRLREMTETMAQLLVQQREAESQEQEDAALDAEINSAREEFGEFDEEWVLTKMYNNPKMDLKDAVQAYKQFEQGIVSKSRKPGPPVLSPGGSVPNQDFNPANLDPKGRRATVAQMLAQAQAQDH